MVRSETGADCLYAPGLREEDQVAALVAAVAPKPVNVLTFGMSLETLSKLGVRRISIGGQLVRSAYADLIRVGTEIAESVDFIGIQGGKLNLNKLYETYRGD
jgi:2-methylisocitrate lyase-like PEP mutase family enzyme